jgi:hypothetical protein
VRTGKGEATCKSLTADGLKLVGIASNLKEAVDWFLAGNRSG